METYDEIFERMRDRYTQLSGIEPYEESDITLRLRVLAGEIYSALVNLEWLKDQMFAYTASGEYLDSHAHTRGMQRREASAAEGTVIFSAGGMATQDIVIPKGSVLSTLGDDPVYFETMEDVCIYKGDYTAHGQVKAMNTGVTGNVPMNHISVIVTPVAGAVTVRNPDPLTGGTDRESDTQLRARVIDSYKNASNGTNCAYYQRVAMETAGVSGACVVPRARGTGTVDVYIAGFGADVSDSVLQEVQERMDRLREVNVDVQVKPATATEADFVFMLDVEDGYEYSKVVQACVNALSDYVASCQVGTKVTLTEAGERLYHVEGVKEYKFKSGLSADLKLESNEYAVLGNVSVTQGVV